MSKLPSFSDALKVITTRTEEALQSNSKVNFGGIKKALYFMHGHPKEIADILQSYTNSTGPKKNQKFPCVALMRDFKEKLRDSPQGLTAKARPRIVFLTLTKPTYRADDRKIKNFDPILVPIVEEFINQIRISEFFGSPTIEDLDIDKWDRYYWGADPAQKTVLNDFVDAIEIEGINLILENNCPEGLTI